MNAELQNSEEWLKLHSVEYMKLTLKDLVDKGKIGKYVKFISLIDFFRDAVRDT